jgi:hypothetical protein
MVTHALPAALYVIWCQNGTPGTVMSLSVLSWKLGPAVEVQPAHAKP